MVGKMFQKYGEQMNVIYTGYSFGIFMLLRELNISCIAAFSTVL